MTAAQSCLAAGSLSALFCSLFFIIYTHSCGTHVPTLGILQSIKLFKMEKVKSTVLRVYFAAGKRIIQILEASYGRQQQFINLLSCPEDEDVQRLELLLHDKRAKEKEIKAPHEQLCVYQAHDIVQKLNANHNVAVVDLGATDLAFITLLSTTALERMNRVGTNESQHWRPPAPSHGRI